MLKTFHGGVHPNDMKAPTADKAIVELDPPKELVFPVTQHIGAPAVPCVNVGDRVYMGQKIADAGGYVSACIHSSVSGTVKAIEKRMNPNGLFVDSIVIENDGLDEIDPDIQGHGDFKKLSAKEIIEIIKAAGLVGLGGATFPVHVKLSPPPEAKIDYVIVNAAECEPYLTSDYRTMLEVPDDIINGLKVIMHIFGLKTGYIGIEDNKPEAVKIMTEAAAKQKDVQIQVITLKTKYPQGGEKQLINAITGRKVGPGQLPWQVGAIVSNADTCRSIYRAVRSGMPLLTRIVTTGGDCVKSPGNFRVRIGTPLGYIIEQTGGLTDEPGKVVMGGPMMGLAVPNRDVPMVKGTSGLLVFNKKSARGFEEGPCLRCAKCVYVCPMNLLPNKLDSAARADDWDTLEKLNITDCIECGSCAYVCPSKRRQVQQIKVAKVKMREAQQKAK